eukprot:TRINITY_DN2241_c0_g3_i2.p1 TRINITY_DN2241_c0_g3~~TRINITY_DN2241_c0_g3_i2.p1  ORF type:complete len:100 (-),score=14.57 TRINITY_DN2241_c0_g3_i2:48-347(-)
MKLSKLPFHFWLSANIMVLSPQILDRKSVLSATEITSIQYINDILKKRVEISETHENVLDEMVDLVIDAELNNIDKFLENSGGSCLVMMFYVLSKRYIV